MATSVGSELGSGVLAFALTWVASGHGPQVASWVLTLTVAPSVALGLLGGAVADRFGARRVMVFGTIALMIVSGSLAAAVAMWGTPPVLLMITATLIGTVASFHRPAAECSPSLRRRWQRARCRNGSGGHGHPTRADDRTTAGRTPHRHDRLERRRTG
ncbi:MFS transporter [Microbacterium oxydans]|nr:MFS transporter [Microbacterium oxydans]